MAKQNLTLYIVVALFGVVIMGVGSFMACLAATTAMRTVGNVILLISLVITGWGFYKWNP